MKPAKNAPKKELREPRIGLHCHAAPRGLLMTSTRFAEQMEGWMQLAMISISSGPDSDTCCTLNL